MTGFALFLLAMLVLASSIKVLFKYSIEVSLFITICSITVLMTVSALAGFIQAMVYSIHVVSAASLVFIIIHFVKNRRDIKETLLGIFTPGVIILLLACLAYYMVTRDKVMIYRDEATSWAVEIKYMFTVGRFKNFGSHPNILAFFSLYMMKITGYSEQMVFMSRWFFVWGCLILPLSSLGWKDWLKAFLYAIGAYCIISVINPDAIYYMDMPLGVVAGALCAAWSVGKVVKKDYVWLGAGFIVLMAIKDEIGIALGFLVLLFLTICNIVRYYMGETKAGKTDWLNVGLNAGLFAVFGVFFFLFMRRHNAISSVLSGIPLLYPAAGIVLLLALAVLIFVFRAKLKAIIGRLNRKIVIGILVLAVAAIVYKFISVLYSSFDADRQKMFYNGISTIYKKGYFGKPAYLLTAFFVIFTSLAALLLLEKKSGKVLLIQSLVITLMITAYSFILLIGYIYDTTMFKGEFIQLQRYYGPIFILASLWLLARLVSGGLEYRKEGYSLIATLLLMSVLIKEFPQPGYLMFGNMEQFRYSVTYGLRKDLRNDSKLITDNISAEDGDVLIIAQPENNKWDVFSAVAWIGYEILPIESERIVLTENPGYYDGLPTSSSDSGDLLKLIDEKGIKYIYVYSADDYLKDEFGLLFEPWGEKSGKLLYKATPEAEYYFSLVDAE